MSGAPTPRDFVAIAAPSLGSGASLAPSPDASGLVDASAARRALLRRPSVVAAAITLGLLVLVALLAPWIAPYDHIAQGPPELKLRPPSLAHPFGTDQFSRDLLSRVMFGARVSLGVAGLSVALATLLGTFVGVVAGFAGGTTDTILMRTVDALLAIPRVLLLVAIVGLFGKLGVPTLVLLLAATGWMGVARLVRAEARAAASRDHVLAARALGADGRRILLHHVLPACLTPAIVAATLNVPSVIALEAGLSYLGLGVQPPFASWGTLVQDGVEWIPQGWWISIAPGLGIVAVMLACTTLGDALRDALDPRELSRR